MESFFGIGIAELFFIAVIALVVLGPERLPGAIREVMKFVRQVRSLTSDLTSQFSEEMQALDDLNPQKILRELTEDPADKKAAAAKTAAAAKSTTAKPPAKPAAKPAPKPATASTTAKPAAKPVAKPAVKTGIGTATITPKATANATTKPPTSEGTEGESVVALSPAADSTGEPLAEMANSATVVDDTPLEAVSPVFVAADSGAAQDENPAFQAEPSILPPAHAQADRPDIAESSSESNGEPGGRTVEESLPAPAEPVVSVKHSAGEGDA